MHCANCRSDSVHVHVHEIENSGRVLRRCECTSCGHRFTTVETIEASGEVLDEQLRRLLERQIEIGERLIEMAIQYGLLDPEPSEKETPAP